MTTTNEDELLNLRHWNRFFRTNPKYAKDFGAPGGFRGTATAPTWTYLQLTEHFGPCGIGWGTDAPDFRTVESEDHILVFCTVCCWYKDADGTRADLFGIGGDRVIKKDARGIFPDDDSFKKAFTDAITNAFSRLGAGADIRLGLFKDVKYMVANMEHFKQQDNLAIEQKTEIGEAQDSTAIKPIA